MIAPVLPKLTPELLNAPPFVVIAAPTVTLPVPLPVLQFDEFAIRLTVSALPVAAIGWLTEMLLAASSVRLRAFVVRLGAIAALTVMFPAAAPSVPV